MPAGNWNGFGAGFGVAASKETAKKAKRKSSGFMVARLSWLYERIRQNFHQLLRCLDAVGLESPSAPVLRHLFAEEGDAALKLVHAFHAVLDADPAVEALALQLARSVDFLKRKIAQYWPQ